jgi:hypothetical protein
MTTVSAISMRSEALLDALRAEFGGMLADRMVEAEATDFYWDARTDERYLGQYPDPEIDGCDIDEELSRIAILSFLAGRWHAGMWLVDGNGCAVEMLWRRTFQLREDAEAAFRQAR